ncbi:flippase-like domain-containing protein [Candidatus Uhrbacteria bacterium]|nr:flippase-like domain-containing protein [Candidatus Uhrbacteria bacterium]
MKGRIAKTLFFLVALALGAALFAFLIWKSGAAETYESLLAFGVLPCAGFVLISLTNFTLYSLRWQIIVNDMVLPSQRVPLAKIFMHRMSGFAAGYLTPASQVAGEPVRVAMLRAEGIPLKEATGSVILDLAFEISAVVAFIISGIILAVSEGLGSGDALMGAAGFIGFLVVVLIAFFWRIAMVLAGIVLLSVVMVSFKAVEAFFIAYFFDVTLSIRDTFLLATLPGIVLLLPVPAGLGVYEGSNAAIFSLLGLKLNAVAYTAIIRIRDFVFIALGVTHAVRHGEKLFAKPT